jgi:signal transduction histidine kinase
LLEAAKRISSSLTTDKVLRAIVESTAQALDAKGCSFLLLSPDRKQLLHRATYGLSDWFVNKGPLAANRSLRQALEGKPVTVVNAVEDERLEYREHIRKEGIASILAIPVIINNEILGTLRIYTSEPRRFSSAEISFVEGVASLGALALERAKTLETLNSDLQQCSLDLSRLKNERQNLFHFLSIAAHDLKAPLSAVQTYFGVMLGGFAGEVSCKHRSILERCSSRIVELLELISDLLDISKIEAGQVVGEMEMAPLKAIVDGSVELARTLAQRKRINLEIDVHQRLPQLHCSGTRLKYVLTHLMSNAIVYTAPAGSVKLKTINGRRAIQIEVSDTGIGIPQEELHQVFEEFFRASNNVEAKGTGLGLSIAKKVVEAHGGQIWVESPCTETGNGCKFVFTIPKKGRRAV